MFFNATSFLQLPGRRGHDTVSVSFQFRTWNPSGLLLFGILANGAVEMGLKEGRVSVGINVASGKSTRIDISAGKAWVVLSNTDTGVTACLT